MNYTPYATLTIDELVLSVCNDENASDREIELITRLQALQDELDDCQYEINSSEAPMQYPAAA